MESVYPEGKAVRLTARLVDGEQAQARIEFLNDHTARIRMNLDDKFDKALQETDGFINTEWPGTALDLQQTEKEVRLSAPGLSILVGKNPFRISFSQGKTHLTETPEGEGIRLKGDQALITLVSSPEEKFLGLGDQGSRHSLAFPPDRAPLDHRGRQLLLAGLGSNRIYYVPFFMSSAGYIDSAWQTIRNSFEWVPNIPDPKGMLKLLKSLNFHVVLWQRSTPAKDTYALWNEAVKRGFLAKGPDGKPFVSPKYGGPSGMVDFTNSEAVKWWQDLQGEAIKMGADSFKLDSAGSAFMESQPEALEMRFHNGMTGRELDNYYGPLYLKTVWEGLKRDLKGKRAVTFTYHSTYFAGGRYPFMALGDRTNKSTRELQVRYLLNYGLSGIPFWQGGEFSSFGLPLVSPELQTRLIPYTYTYWRAAHETGEPIARAMALESPGDPRAYEADMQFLFGDSFLVAPLVKGSEEWRASFFLEKAPETARVGHGYVLGQVDWQRVFLPAGEWIHYWDQKKYRGPRWYYFRPEKGNETILVKGGAIIPMGSVVEYAGQKPLDTLTLEVYPYGESQFTLYEDDGETYDYESGAFAKTLFKCRETEGGLELEIGPSHGRYQGKPERRTYMLQIRGTTQARAVKVGAEELPELFRQSEVEAAESEIYESLTRTRAKGPSEKEWEDSEAGWFYRFASGYDRTLFIKIPSVPADEKVAVQIPGVSVVRYYMD